MDLQEKKIYEIKSVDGKVAKQIQVWQKVEGIRNGSLQKYKVGNSLQMQGFVPRLKLAKLAKKLFQDIVVRDLATKKIVSIIEKEKFENEVIKDNDDYIEMMIKVKEALKQGNWSCFYNSNGCGLGWNKITWKKLRSWLSEYQKDNDANCRDFDNKDDVIDALMDDMGYSDEMYRIFDFESWLVDTTYSGNHYIMTDEDGRILTVEVTS